MAEDDTSTQVPPASTGFLARYPIFKNLDAQRWWATAAILATGFTLGGYLLGDGLSRSHRTNRSVTVRGVAERDVTADLAVWTLTFSAKSADMPSAQTKVDHDSAAIRAFFKEQGFADDVLQTTGVDVSMESDGENKPSRFVVRQRLTLRSSDITRTEKAVHHQFELVRRDVFLESGSQIKYIYTGLNKIKPEMVAAATRDARASAEQFAHDSGASVGGIKNATQGYFEVTARDGDSSESWGNADSPYKKVRVVTSVNYYLR
ncbi:MAG: hypothetical protein RLY97_1132 [Pseudomonadota bacterium]